MSSFVSKAGPESEWGSDSRIAAVRRWHEKSVASRHDQLVLLLDGADLRPGLRVLNLACAAGMAAVVRCVWSARSALILDVVSIRRATRTNLLASRGGDRIVLLQQRAITSPSDSSRGIRGRARDLPETLLIIARSTGGGV